MSMWEDKYQEYKNGKLDSRMDELKEKLEERKANKEELKEYNKMQTIKVNYKQIEKVIEKKTELMADLEKINDELRIRNDLRRKARKLEKLDKKLQDIREDKERIISKLNNSNLSKEEKARLIAERDAINEKMNENSQEYSNITLDVQDVQKVQSNSRLSNSTKEELETKKIEIYQKISMCDFVGKNLLNGLRWDSIEKRMGNFKYTSHDGKLEEVIDKERKIKQNENSINKDMIKAKREKMVRDFKLDTSNIEKSLKPEESEFDKKHPRFTKIKKWFKNVLETGKKKLQSMHANWTRNNETGKEKLVVEENKTETEKPVIEKQKIEEKEIADFLAELKYKEPEEKRKETEKKLAELRAKNRAVETEKFGKDYADKSDYRKNKDNGPTK